MATSGAQAKREIREEAEEAPTREPAAPFAPPVQTSAGGPRSDLDPGQNLPLEGAKESVDRFMSSLQEDELPPDLSGPNSTPLQVGPKSINWWYPRLADWLLENPDKYLKDAAKVFDVRPSWMYALFNSDTFQDYYKARCCEVSKTVEHKARNLADRLLDSFHEDLDSADTTGLKIPVDTRLKIFDTTMKRFGYGDSRPQPGLLPAAPTVVTVNALGSVTSDELSRARRRLAEKNKQIEHEVLPSEASAPSEEPQP